MWDAHTVALREFTDGTWKSRHVTYGPKWTMPRRAHSGLLLIGLWWTNFSEIWIKVPRYISWYNGYLVMPIDSQSAPINLHEVRAFLWFVVIWMRSIYPYHDVIKWKHFPRYWPFVRGIYRSSVNFPHKGQWRGAWISSLICAWTNGYANNRDAGELRRHRAYHSITAMFFCVAAVKPYAYFFLYTAYP